MRRQPRPFVRGFTFIEIMIVVAVIAILAAIALPAYTEYIRKSRRAEAVRLINAFAQEQERFRANNASYAATTAALYPAASAPAPTSAYYTMAVASASSTEYAVTATTAGAQLSDGKCTSMTFWMRGGLPAEYRSTGSASANVCWSR
jgi:type IV pilus assembly protein PilE